MSKGWKKNSFFKKNEFLLLLSKEVRDYSSFIQASMSLSDGIKWIDVSVLLIDICKGCIETCMYSA